MVCVCVHVCVCCVRWGLVAEDYFKELRNLPAPVYNGIVFKSHFKNAGESSQK